MRKRIKLNAICTVKPDDPQSYSKSRKCYSEHQESLVPEEHKEAFRAYQRGLISKPGKPTHYKMFGMWIPIGNQDIEMLKKYGYQLK